MQEARVGGKRERCSLGHRDKDRAKREADLAAAKLAMAVEALPDGPEAESPRELTLQALFDRYGEEVSPTKGERSQNHDGRATEMFLKYFGPGRVVSTLGLREWERFIKDRGEGRIGPGVPPWIRVENRTIEMDLRFLLAVFNWAVVAGDLKRNPFKGYKTPKEKNPLRVKLTDEEYETLLGVSMAVDWRFHVALVLAHETGHRVGAIRQLLWSDIDLEGRTIRWRAETEKTGYGHATPMTEKAELALRGALGRSDSIGESPVLPSPTDSRRSVSRNLTRDWWKKAERLAELAPKRGRGWHSIRRKFASDLKQIPLKTLQKLGGWRTHQTILMCYQDADEDEMREALETRRTGT
jgi:integrase